MTNIRFKPQRRLRSEILSLVPLVVLIAALFFAFPYKILRLKKVETKFSQPGCAYVELTGDQELEVMKKIHSAISTDVVGVRDLRADLSISTIPERPSETIVKIENRKSPKDISKPEIELSSVPATLAAPEPVELIPTEERKPAETFSKEEMLKLID
ncbi:MAG: hypothetical protein J6W10_09410 [Kiritimatiellae bacterium]|jgi:hypothetical protein|nr:hypothetical protein [Kiritimatiellia bacterium]